MALNARRRRWTPGWALAAALVVLAAGAVSADQTSVAAPARHPRADALLKRKWGIDPLGISLSASGYMLDFRYQVLDPQSAEPLFVRSVRPVLIEEATGRRFSVPAPATVGPLRAGERPRQGGIYWVFFANPGRSIRSGERVTVVIGDFRAEGLVVE